MSHRIVYRKKKQQRKILANLFYRFLFLVSFHHNRSSNMTKILVTVFHAYAVGYTAMGYPVPATVDGLGVKNAILPYTPRVAWKTL